MVFNAWTLPPLHFRAKNKLYPLEKKTEITLSPYVEIGMYITSLKKEKWQHQNQLYWGTSNADDYSGNIYDELWQIDEWPRANNLARRK